MREGADRSASRDVVVVVAFPRENCVWIDFSQIPRSRSYRQFHAASRSFTQLHAAFVGTRTRSRAMTRYVGNDWVKGQTVTFGPSTIHVCMYHKILRAMQDFACGPCSLETANHKSSLFIKFL